MNGTKPTYKPSDRINEAYYIGDVGGLGCLNLRPVTETGPD